VARTADATDDERAVAINYWGNAIMSDLTKYWNATRVGRLHSTVPALAAAAHRWFRDAWPRVRGTELGRFPVAVFTMEVFPQPGYRGELLAEVDVLTGRYTIVAE
jgi:hypothetical protein